MKKLNKLRLLSGIPIDPTIEITENKEEITEARSVPTNKRDLKQMNDKMATARLKSIGTAIKHLKQAVSSLEKIPAHDFGGDIPRFIHEIEELLHSSDGNSLSDIYDSSEDLMLKIRQADLVKYHEEQEEVLACTESDEGDQDIQIEETTRLFKGFNDFEEDPAKPVNVSDGSSNDEQVFDDPMDAQNDKDEAPAQLRTGDEQSEQDQSDGLDIEAEMKIPSKILKSLDDEIKLARKEAERLDSSNKESALFYNDLANAFEDLNNHLKKGTKYDFKLAQSYAQSLMGPMIHKLPDNVWKFLTNGGEVQSLKDYMKPVKDPITGPRNTIK